MSRITTNLLAAALLGQLVGLIAWIDPLFVPFVLVAPIVTGAVAAAAEVGYRWIAVLWASIGLSMLWTDWVVNNEDQLFHLVLSVLMPLLAGVGWGVVRLAVRARGAAAA